MQQSNSKKSKHTIAPIYDKNSRVLVLGSFPSVKSREEGFFYGHKQNRFWKVVAGVKNEKTPETIEEKKTFLLKNNIALWDVVSCCDITGSSDSSIKNVEVNDLTAIFEVADIKAIFLNGRTAQRLYDKYLKDKIEIKAYYLPSTSPANANYSLEKLIEEWGAIDG